MKQTTIALGKSAILFAAAFFSATAFAATCPTLDEIHLDQQKSHWVTDSGWSSFKKPATSNLDQYSFYGADFVVNKTPRVEIPSTIQGKNVFCRYINTEVYNPDAIIIMSKAAFKADVEIPAITGSIQNSANGHWISSEWDDNHYAYACKGSLEYCKFDVIPKSVAPSDISTSPFGR